MAESAGVLNTGGYDALLLKLDEGVAGALYRIAIGFVTIPAHDILFGSLSSGWSLVPCLLAILFLLRLGLAVTRKILPFPADVVEIWAVRRRMAKYYDSYQWRKLLWIGIGLGLYVAMSGDHRPVAVGLTFFCIATGAAGALIWRSVAADETLPKPAPKWRKKV